MVQVTVCHRCKGTMVRERDLHGWYEQCLQCGYLRDLENVVAKSNRTQKKITSSRD